MPRISKFDDKYEKVVYWSKLFIYCEPSWNNLSPIVEIIRGIHSSNISYKYGKGQHVIKTYGSQYNHNVVGCEFKKYDDYITNILKSLVKFVFIFGDYPDTFSTNLMNFSKKNNIVTINYSNIDSTYHFSHSKENVFMKFKSPLDVINAMRDMTDYISFKQVVEAFPDFNLIPEIEDTNQPVLEKCLQLLKESTETEINKKDNKKIQVIDNKQYFDANLYKLRKFNKEALKKKESLKIDLYDQNREQEKNNPVKCTISKFFKNKK
jgi:hypothetical protein